MLVEMLVKMLVEGNMLEEVLVEGVILLELEILVVVEMLV